MASSSAAASSPEPDRAAATPGRDAGAAGAGRAARTGTGSVPRTSHLQRDAAERVLRRAVELVDADGGVDDGISVAALLEAADELGIDAADVLRAVAEERLGLLVDQHPLSDRVLGPDVVVATRIVGGDAAEVLGRADAWLRRDALRRTRDQAEWAEYRRRSDPVGSMQRAARSIQGDRQLDRVHRVRVVTSEIGPGRTLVALVVDAHGGRVATAAGTGAATLTGVGAALANLTVVHAGWLWLAVPAAGAAGAGVVVGRRAFLDRVDEELEALLDRIGSEVRPPRALDDLTDRVLGGRAFRPRAPRPPRAP